MGDRGGRGSRRSVLMSGSYGRHSRPNLAKTQPNGTRGYPRAVADAIADWWLLGEADFVVDGQWSRAMPGPSSSYVTTAAARSSRAQSFYVPIYQGKCPDGVDCAMPIKPL